MIGLYVIITNPVKSYEDIAKVCVDNQIKMLQFRQKHLSDREILISLEKIGKITQNSPTNLIIDDRVDLALASECDGVHVGQDDMPFKLARKLLPNKLIGVSTHTIKQAKSALGKRPDYIGFGPIYKTPTKEKPDRVVGTKLLSKVVNMSDIPVVAIGGIDEKNIKDVINTGVKSISLVRYLMNYKDLEKRIKYIQNILAVEGAK